ncbi:MAG: helix-turn-helix transcriptional regulator [Spirochaetes bacterium]|nr:helix-turn-helix transcriptional regulator [Spirochaetota bacterium]
MESEIENEYQLYLKQFGKNLKRERKKAGLSQEILAEINGIDYKYYQRIESGNVNITIKTLFKISKSLNIDLICLLNFENESVK